MRRLQDLGDAAKSIVIWAGVTVAAPVVVKPAMELKRASTGPMRPERMNGRAPTSATPNQHTTTMRNMLCLET